MAPWALARFPRIADYGFLSDCATCALVAPSGNVEWLCLPRFDSPSVFGAILDRDAGRFRLGPDGVSVPAARRYLPGTMVLETSWGTRGGWIIVRDVLVIGPWHHEQQRSQTYRRSPLNLVQAAVVVLPGVARERWLDAVRSRWPLLAGPAAAAIGLTFLPGIAAVLANDLSLLALVFVPPLAALGIAWAMRWRDFRLVPLIPVLVAVAWSAPDSPVGKSAALGRGGAGIRGAPVASRPHRRVDVVRGCCLNVSSDAASCPVKARPQWRARDRAALVSTLKSRIERFTRARIDEMDARAVERGSRGFTLAPWPSRIPRQRGS